jgi:hypothetical protein
VIFELLYEFLKEYYLDKGLKPYYALTKKEMTNYVNNNYDYC